MQIFRFLEVRSLGCCGFRALFGEDWGVRLQVWGAWFYGFEVRSCGFWFGGSWKSAAFAEGL